MRDEPQGQGVAIMGYGRESLDKVPAAAAGRTVYDTCSYNAIHVDMALNIRNSETEQLAAELAMLTGQTKTAAVTEAIRNHLERLRRERSGRTLSDELGRRCAKLPVHDGRPAEEILGYDESGLPR